MQHKSETIGDEQHAKCGSVLFGRSKMLPTRMYATIYFLTTACTKHNHEQSTGMSARAGRRSPKFYDVGDFRDFNTVTQISLYIFISSPRSMFLLSTRRHNMNPFDPKCILPPTSKTPSVQQQRQRQKWSDLPRRLTTICVGIPLLWMIWSYDDRLRVLFFQMTHALAAYEWTQMYHSSNPASAKNHQHHPTTTWGFPILSIGLANLSDSNAFLLGFVLTTAFSTIAFTKAQDSIHILQGLVLITIPFRSWLSIADTSFFHVVSLLLTVWNCDTGALVVGRICGGGQRRPYTPIAASNFIPSQRFRQLLHRISPHKSVEGLIGGFVFGTLTYVGLPWIWNLLWTWNVPMGSSSSSATTTIAAVIAFSKRKRRDHHHYHFTMMIKEDLCIGSCLSILAIVGDLWESSLKRQYAVKDTGKLLPGHGGVLDRFDSSLLAVLVYPLILLWFPHRPY